MSPANLMSRSNFIFPRQNYISMSLNYGLLCCESSLMGGVSAAFEEMVTASHCSHHMLIIGSLLTMPFP